MIGNFRKASHRTNPIYPIKNKPRTFPLNQNWMFSYKSQDKGPEGTRILINKVKGAMKAAKMRAGPKEPNPWKLLLTTLILQLQAPRITLSFR